MYLSKNKDMTLDFIGSYTEQIKRINIIDPSRLYELQIPSINLVFNSWIKDTSYFNETRPISQHFIFFIS